MKKSSEELLDAMAKVVADCPWLPEQSLKSYAEKMREEADEVMDALEKGSDQALKEEIGDLLWDAFMLAHLAERDGKFSAREPLQEVVKKFKRRKPYIWEGRKVTIEEAERIWREQKAKESKQ